MTFVATGGSKHLAMQGRFLLLPHGAFMVYMQAFSVPSTKTTKLTSNMRIKQLTPCFFLSDNDVFGCLCSITVHLLVSDFALHTAVECITVTTPPLPPSMSRNGA